MAAAAAALGLWRQGLRSADRELLGGLLGEPSADRAGCWLALLAGLHDLGKATPGFQGRSDAHRPHLVSLGFPFPLAACPDHDRLGALLVQEQLQVPPNASWRLSPPAARALALAVAGHHRPEPPLSGPRLSRARDLGGDPWPAARAELTAALLAVTDPGAPPPGLAEPGDDLLPALSRLTRLADWLASSPDLLPAGDPDDDLAAWWSRAVERAELAVAALRREASTGGIGVDEPPLLRHLDDLGREAIRRMHTLDDRARAGLRQAWDTHAKLRPEQPWPPCLVAIVHDRGRP